MEPEPFRRRAARQTQPGKFCRVHGLDLVNGNGAPQKQQRQSYDWRCVSVMLETGRLLPVLLDARGTQARKTVTVDRILPGEKLLDGERVTRARFLEREKPATNRRHHLGLATDHPAPRAGSRQIGNGQGATVGPDDILHPRAMRFGHSYTHTRETDTERGE